MREREVGRMLERRRMMEKIEGRRGKEGKREREREGLELGKPRLTRLCYWWLHVCKDKICPVLQSVKL